jgi:hypothetical protein
MEAFRYLVTAYDGAQLQSISIDQSADAITDVESILRAKWKKLKINYSLWHKVCCFVVNRDVYSLGVSNNEEVGTVCVAKS